MMYAWWRITGAGIGRPRRFRAYGSASEARRFAPPRGCVLMALGLRVEDYVPSGRHEVRSRVLPDRGLERHAPRWWAKCSRRGEYSIVTLLADTHIPEPLIREEPR